MGARRPPDIETFGLEPGRRLAGKYVVGELLGKGWEGEVYHVTEIATGIERAAKIFFPKRNPHNRALKFYARKLNKLRNCSILIQYHTQESFRYKGMQVPFLVSDYVEGELLSDLLARQPGGRLHPFEALHLLYALVRGVEEIHRLGEYHGDLHSDNVIVRRVGLGFDVKVVDMYHWGRATAAHLQDDVCYLVRILYDAVGGARHYAKQPPEIKAICCGLKRSLITKKFRTASHLRRYLETFEWQS
ncbi:MAG: serine/threonine protein kinase [Candidatus Dadabacteria bacterium]|nr:MAG: serine/threonine protein kinase [Candidatus Dadabacteria bacterium]